MTVCHIVVLYIVRISSQLFFPSNVQEDLDVQLTNDNNVVSKTRNISKPADQGK